MKDSAHKRVIAIIPLLLALLSGQAFAAYSYKGAQFEGTLSQGINIGGVQGEETNSVLDEGLNYETNANLRVYHDDLGSLNEMFESWQFDSEIYVRKTDDAQIAGDQDLDLLYLQTRFYNPYLDFTFGDFSADFSPMTLNRSLEGFQLIATVPQTETEISTVLSRAYEGDDFTQYTRYVVGGRVEQNFLKDQFELFDRTLVNDFTAGFNVVHNFDAGNSVEDDDSISDLSNFVTSFNARLKFLDALTTDIEVARSRHDDEDENSITDDKWGTAIKIRNTAVVRNLLGKTRVTFDYERTSPGFFTDSGSASPDREAVYGRVSHRFKKMVTVDGSYREFHDNLKDTDTTTLRIKNPQVKMTVKPFEEKGEYWRDLAVKLKYASQVAESTDGTIHNQAHTFQGLVSHRVKDISVSGGFKSKRVNDKAGSASRRTQSLLTRVGYDFTRENITVNPYFDYVIRYQRDHSPEEAEIYGDMSFGTSLSLFDRFRMNVNYGYNDVNRAIVGSDTEAQSFDVSAEVDITDQLMLVGTYFLTDNNFEDHILDYDEDYGEIKLVWSV